MSNLDRIEAEQSAYKCQAELLEKALVCKQLYEKAELPIPERLASFLGMNGVGDSERSSVAPSNKSLSIDPPDLPKPPPDAANDWISIEVERAITTTIVLAILRQHSKPVRAGDLTRFVEDILPQTTSGSIANTGTRLVADGVIERTDEGWKLLKPERAGVIKDGRVWGPLHIFAKNEQAAHRREAIVHILKHFSTGLQLVQLVQQVKVCKWVRAGVNKDLLKMDLVALQDEKKIRRRGNTRKWELAVKSDEEE